MNRKVLMALLGCLAVMAMLGFPALADASDGTPVLDVQTILNLDSALSLAERPEASVPPDPGSWLGEEFAVVKPKTYWVQSDNAEAAVPVDPGSVSFESPSQDYISDFKLGVLIVGCVGCSLIGGCYSLRS